LESWAGLKQELIKMFDRKISFTSAMQKIEARRWMQGKETFDQYAIEKLALIHRLDLPSSDIINLLIGGIMQASLRATALTLTAASIDQFLEAMRRITHGVGDLERRNSSPSKSNRFKDVVCRECGKKGHLQRDCKAAELSCVYCKEKGHTRTECQKLLKLPGGGIDLIQRADSQGGDRRSLNYSSRRRE
jgi:hypothetical protein